MADQSFLVLENCESLFAVRSNFVFQIVFEKEIYPLPFSKTCIGGFFLYEDFLIPVFSFDKEGFKECSETFVIIDCKGVYVSLPVKNVLEICKSEVKGVENIEHSTLFSEIIFYKNLFEIPVLDFDKLYKLAGFN